MRLFLLILVFSSLTDGLFAQPRLGESQITQTERRMALVIGMNDYEHVRPLKNPSNDADDMTAKLKDLGFTVTTIKNQTLGQTNASINKFLNTLRANDVVMFYFSGHGIGYLDDNFLLPIDARIECLEQISAYSLSVNRITADIQSKRVRNCFVILDACRSLGNLYVCNDNQSSKDILSHEGFIFPENQTRGNIIVYATQYGQTAEDNQKKRNGLFTQELLKNISIPDLTFGTILSKTALSVVDESKKMNKYQEPTIYGLIGMEFIFLKTPTKPTSDQEDKTKNILIFNDLYAQAYKLYKEKKYTESLPLFLQAAEKAHSGARNTLGYMYEKGEGVPQDKVEAVQWYRKAAEQGDALGQINLGVMYNNGEGVPQDKVEAVKWYRKAAEQGNAMAQYGLGIKYSNGEGVPQDKVEAVKWYRKAAEQGHAKAQNALGYMYEKGEGVPQDKVEAVIWYRKAAEKGHSGAQNTLGYMYEKGEGVPQDKVEAVKWYRKAAEKGDSGAQNNLGYMYAKGEGVPQDKVEAVKWHRKAADQGHANAQFILGIKYKLGVGVPEDNLEAVKWFRKAAEQGDSKGQFHLGNMYNYGLGVQQDKVEAFKWYRKAAEQGDVDGQASLAYMYYNGEGGVPQDKVEAIKWYRKAADQGHTTAIEMLK